MNVVILVIRWFIGLFFLLIGFGGCMTDEVGIGVVMTVLGLLTIPLSLLKKKVKSKNVNSSKELTDKKKRTNESISSISKKGNTRTISINVESILENVIEKERLREEAIKNYEYQYQAIRGWSLQLLESVNLLRTTKNFDTLKGRYDFIVQFYNDLCLAKHNERYVTDIQYGIDRFKSTYYDTILQDFEIDFLYDPEHEKLKEYYVNCIEQSFNAFAEDQDHALVNLKKISAKKNRIAKIYDIADQSIREIDSMKLSEELSNTVTKNIRDRRDNISSQYTNETNLILSENTDSLVVNPKSSFPLTLYNAPATKLRKVAKLLKSDSFNHVVLLMPLFAEHNIKCQEIEEYINKYKSIYLQRIQDEKDKSTEYQQSTEMDRLDLEQEYKAKATTMLYEIANCNLQELFEYNEIPLTVDDDLIREYGFENLALYMKLQNKVGKVVTNWERKTIEKLSKTDLIAMIDEIEIDDVLLTLPLKILNAIAEKEEGYFKRKKTAIEFINEHNLSHNLGKHIATRKVFKVNSLSNRFENVNIIQVANSWAYLREYLRLFVDTYRDGEYNSEQISRNSSYIDGWKVEQGYNDYCHRAKEECSKTYTKSNAPKMPFHVGCTCRLRSEMFR